MLRFCREAGFIASPLRRGRRATSRRGTLPPPRPSWERRSGTRPCLALRRALVLTAPGPLVHSKRVGFRPSCWDSVINVHAPGSPPQASSRPAVARGPGQTGIEPGSMAARGSPVCPWWDGRLAQPAIRVNKRRPAAGRPTGLRQSSLQPRDPAKRIASRSAAWSPVRTGRLRVKRRPNRLGVPRGIHDEAAVYALCRGRI